MKYLYNHTETTKHLHAWSGTIPLVRASFYFWIPGQQMQKSLEGLLQTLLYHILHTCPSLVPILCRDRAIEQSREKVSTQPWTLNELQKAFAIFQTQSQVAANFYFHVDGLDEYCGDSWDIINTLQALATCPNVKLCLSSRPWNSFQDAFGRANPCVLRLHEWTRKDIKIFAHESLMSYTAYSDFDPSLFNDLIQDISDRAQGVFLWVRLVVRSLRDGIINDDPVSILHERLRAIPTDLEEFFELILESVEDIYRSRMASTFLAALNTHRPLKMIDYYFLEQEDPTFGLKLKATQWSDYKIQRAVDQTQRRLNGRFRGLLEPTSDIGIRYYTSVDFLHRTLRDFLKTERMMKWLISRASKELNTFMALSCALTATYRFVNLEPTMEDLKIAIELASHAAHDTGEDDRSFAIVDMAEEAYQRIRPDDLHRGCGIHCYILRFAIAVGHTEYLSYRFHKEGTTLDLNNILKHTVEFRLGTNESLDPCLPNTLRRRASSHKEYKRDTTKNYWGSPTPWMVKVLLDLGADPNAPVDGISSWTSFLHQATGLMHTPYNEQYKELVEVFHQGDLILESGSSDWTNMLERKASRSTEGLRNMLNYLQYMFSHGMNPNLATQGTTLFTIFLRTLTKRSLRLTGDRKQVKNELLLAFLQSGADITRVYKDGSCDGWLNSFSQELMSFAILSRQSTHVEELQIFLQHGLDLNTVLRGSITIWYRLLSNIHRGLQQKTSKEIMFHQIVHSTILLSLKHGADPDAPGLPRILDWMKSETCLLSANEIWQIERALPLKTGKATSGEGMLSESTDAGIQAGHGRKRKGGDEFMLESMSRTKKERLATKHGNLGG
jgi:hypothetical protein